MKETWYCFNYVADNGKLLEFSFDNIPFRKPKNQFSTRWTEDKYIRFYSVLPKMDAVTFDNHMKRVKKLARSL